MGFAAAVAGDGQYRYHVRANGLIGWGDGTASYDTNLYRSAAGILASDNSFNSTIQAEQIAPAVSVVIPTNFVSTRSSKYEITGSLSLEIQGTGILAIL